MSDPRQLVPVGDLDRSTYLGGGDIAAIMRLSPWRTPVDVFFAKTQDEQPVFDLAQQKRLTRGKRLEPYVVQMLAEDYGITIDQRNQRYRHPDYDFIAAEIDFEWHDDADQRLRNGEIKTVALGPWIKDKWGEAGTDEIPVEYATQSMYGLAITGRDVCQYGVLFGMDDLTIYQVKRDQEDIDNMIRVAVTFWNDHILTRTPPMPATLGDIGKLWPRATRDAIQATPEIEVLLKSHALLSERASRIEQARETIAFEIREFVKDHTAIARGGVTLATLREEERTTIDADALKLLFREAYDATRRIGRSRVLRHKKEKK